MNKQTPVELTRDPEDKDPHHKKQQEALSSGSFKDLRATIPEVIVAFLKLQAGDKLEWKMDILNDKRVAIVHKAELEKKENLKEINKAAAMSVAIDDFLRTRGKHDDASKSTLGP